MIDILLVFLALFSFAKADSADPVENINGPYQVHMNMHYSNKTTVTWGENSEKLWNVTISMSPSTATYDCTNTSTYVCVDPAWIYDYNKL